MPSMVSLTTARRLDRAPILVVGAGVGGLAVALALAQQELEVRVFEQLEGGGDEGAGLQLAPNAFAACEALGVTEALRARATYPDAALVMDAIDRSTLARIALGETFRTRFGHPYALLQRSDLRAALLDSVRAHANIEVLRSVRIVGVHQSKRSVTLVDNKDYTYSGAIAVASDGAESAIRAQLIGDSSRLSGEIVYRGVVRAQELNSELRSNGPVLWVAPGHHLVHYPVRNGERFNFVLSCKNPRHEAPQTSDGSHNERLTELEATSPFRSDLADLLGSKRHWTLADREPLARWTFGRVTLLGDAAHLMLPHIAQGACMALEDAVTLGNAVRLKRSNLPEALEIYNRARHARAARAILTARQLCAVYNAANAERETRNQLWRQRTQAQLYDELAWLYGWTPEQCLAGT